eukprot:767954-Hanusia_phi.AAC.2
MDEAAPGQELEAQFSDGAWYDITLRAADPSRDRFLVQVLLYPVVSPLLTSSLQARDFPDEEEWVDAGHIRRQSQPYDNPPKVGSTVLALHRSTRSDLFFEGVVKEVTCEDFCRIQFSDGRVKGQIHKVSLDDVNKISTESLPSSFLKGLCKTNESVRLQTKSQVVDFSEGDFVLIEGPDEVCWVAQLMEPYRGKLSDEIDDVDDEGPMVSVRWFYKPGELPKHVLKACSDVDWTHEVFVSLHRDQIDGRLIIGKCSCCFGWERPDPNFQWMDDQLFSYRTWDPSKKRVSTFTCPLLGDELRLQIEFWIKNFPYPGACRPSDHGRVSLDKEASDRSRSTEEVKVKSSAVGGDRSSRSASETPHDEKPSKDERQRKQAAEQHHDRSHERELEGRSPRLVQSSSQHPEKSSRGDAADSAQEPREMKKKHNRPGSAELAALQEDIRNSKKIIVEEGTKRHCKLPNFFTFDEPAPKKPPRPGEGGSHHSLRHKEPSSHRDAQQRDPGQREQHSYHSDASKSKTRSLALETAHESSPQQAVKTEKEVDEAESRMNKKPKKDPRSDTYRSTKSDSDDAKELEPCKGAGKPVEGDVKVEEEGKGKRGSDVEVPASNGAAEEAEDQSHHVIRLKLHRKEEEAHEAIADVNLEGSNGTNTVMLNQVDEERRDDDEDVGGAGDLDAQPVMKEKKHKKDSKKKKSKSKRRDRDIDAPARRAESPAIIEERAEEDLDMVGEQGGEGTYGGKELNASDTRAVNLFILEGLKIVCMRFFRENQHKSVAYLLHRSSSDASAPVSCSVGISDGFRTSNLHAQCARFLQRLSQEKIEAGGTRRVWHVCRHEKQMQDVKLRELSLDNAITPSILS